MRLLLFTAATAVVWSVASSLPQCSGDCGAVTEGFCESECYEGADNLLCSCESETFGGAAVCSGACPDGVDGGAAASSSACAAACAADKENCAAYIFDDNFLGPRCRLLSKCLSMEEAEVTIPCSDCQTSRTCAFCPSLTYTAGQTSIHWICESSVDPYEKNMPDGSFCTPSHKCKDASIPESITCNIKEGGTGEWQDTDGNGYNAETLDQACPCSDLIIPNSVDTNLFCSGGQPELETNDGKEYWTLNSKFSNCDLVCDGSVFIPVQCTFGTGDSDTTTWSITYGGQPSELDKDCFACSFSACDAFTTEDPGPGPSPTTPTASTATPTASTAAPTASTATPTASTAAPTNPEM